MESCACKLNFDTKMFGLAYVPKEQGILLTVRKNSGLQPDTASYLQFDPCVEEMDVGNIWSNSPYCPAPPSRNYWGNTSWMANIEEREGGHQFSSKER